MRYLLQPERDSIRDRRLVSPLRGVGLLAEADPARLLCANAEPKLALYVDR